MIGSVKSWCVRWIRLFLVTLGGFATCCLDRSWAEGQPTAVKPPPGSLVSHLENYCFDCHDPEIKKAGLDLTSLSFDLENPESFRRWVRVHDRVQAGEMPPKDKPRPAPKEIESFEASLSNALHQADLARVARDGRATRRRLNRYEYEATLRDLLQLPALEVKDFLPEDSEAFGFNKIGDALDVSHVQLARYLGAADFALRQAIAPQATQPECATNRFYAMEQRRFFGLITLGGPKERRSFPLVGLDLQLDLMGMDRPRLPEDRSAERREQEAMAVVVSTYEPTEIRFNQFKAPVTGRYLLRFCAHSIQMAADFKSVSPGRRPEPITLYADTEPRLLRKLGGFDVGPEPTIREIDAWLLAGETIRPDAARLFRSRPPDHKNPLTTPEGMPGVAFRWMEVEGPLIDQWPPHSHRVLFGDLPLIERDEGVSIVSTDMETDARALMRSFLRQAYRHPVQEGEMERFLKVVRHAADLGFEFADAMIAGYTAVLTSPGFLYFQAEPGPLDDFALAERLAFFLWNSTPDETLRGLAAAGRLRDSKVLEEQTNRLLNDPRSRRFVDSFLDYWLDLRFIAGTAPDTELYPDYQLDDLLVESMIEETQLYFQDMIVRNRGAAQLVTSDWAMINERLAAHYGIPEVEGVALRPVALNPESVRGGLLTQASVLKVTANGTTTSPVTRGAWVMERLLGQPPPTPPASVPAVEPDTRGTTTIRDQLAKHRTEESCNACHRLIDPAGFALENFDVMGGWRDRYRALGGGEKVQGIGHNGLHYRFGLGLAVDASGELPDGRAFSDVRQLKELLADNEEQLARNLAQKLIIYATGASIGFSDRAQVSKMLARARDSRYGCRTLIHEIIGSELFMNK